MCVVWTLDDYHNEDGNHRSCRHQHAVAKALLPNEEVYSEAFPKATIWLANLFKYTSAGSRRHTILIRELLVYLWKHAGYLVCASTA